jgi:hypothetical protein
MMCAFGHRLTAASHVASASSKSSTPGDVFHDTFAIRRPGIDAESEVSSRCGHRPPLLPQSSSASRFTAGAAGFLNLSQSFDLPLR